MSRTRIVIAAAAATLAVGATAVAANAQTARAVPLDLIGGHDWSHLAGATPTAGGVRVTGLGRGIVDTDGKNPQPNPPVNIRGPRLVTSGDFDVTATLSGVGATAGYIQLYNSVPIIYDESRQEPASVRVGVTGGKVEVKVWNGKSAGAVTTKSFGSGLSGTVTVDLSTAGSNLTVSANGKQLGAVADPGVFTSGTTYLGLDATTGGSWTLTRLQAAPVGSGTVSIADAPPLAQPQLADSLRKRARALPRPIDVGAALASDPLLADGAYRATAGGQFSMLTPENDMKPQFVHPQPNVYTFTDADTLVDFAQANGMKVHAHTLVWNEALPTWMRSLTGAQAIHDAMVDHIRTVAGHFKGRVAEWDVINEPLSDDYAGVRKESPWFKAMGEQYIDTAFKEAHAADPGAKLFLNEYGVEGNGQKWDALVALLKRLKSRGVPIDGVGLQTHEYEKSDRTSVSTMRGHMQTLAGLGLVVRISEMDVTLASGESTSVQAREFADKLALCRQQPTCTSFTTWGFTDRYGSTADTDTYPAKPGNALPWNSSIQPKPAYSSMLAALK